MVAIREETVREKIMHCVDPRGDYQIFLALATRLLRLRVVPENIQWCDSLTGEPALFPSTVDENDLSVLETERSERIASVLGNLGRLTAQHIRADRWSLLYSVAWRMLIEHQRHLLADALDPEVRSLDLLAKAVRRDIHKMKAFVRFRRVEAVKVGEGERFIAWHRPDHRIVRLAAPFFARRFGVMRWTIFTPHESADWDGETLRFAPGVSASHVCAEDHLEQFWQTYYASIFNPARIKIGAMIKEMPRRYWATLPETRIINDLLLKAPDRVKRMIDYGVEESGAEEFVPATTVSLPILQEAARGCAGCGLAELATQTVFGEGPLTASIMLVGEQPGDEEDRAGRPFVGPAGQLLNQALSAAGLHRTDMYVTNAVKHFKFMPRGNRRIHQRPGPTEIRACKPWLLREIAMVNPDVIVMLGATAGQSLLGPGYRVNQARGQWLEHPSLRAKLLATVHPSMILRTPDEGQSAAFEQFVKDLNQLQA